MGNKSYGHEKQQEGWNQGKAHESPNQFSPELRAQYPLFPLENQFDQISDDQEDEQEQEDNIDVDQAEDDDVMGNGNSFAYLGEPHLKIGKCDDEQGDNKDDVEFTPPLLGLPSPVEIHHTFSPLNGLPS
jgi:hypothetical protein